ncbi:MAG: FAD-dependent oxidoreductase [Deltaproteobacteria bacterium]|nr:FAD-dependent oxidoreductase [Deltaproteobacteria bacterium]
MQQKVVVLGAGLSGLSAAYHLNAECDIYEKNKEIGGLCRSIRIGGFTFDYGPHILYTIDPYASVLIKGLLKENLASREREAWVFHDQFGCYTRFPFQGHLYGLPVEVVKECILGLFNAKMENGKPAPKDYYEWMERIFGKGITKHLMVPYAEKLWTIHPSGMNYDWIERRVPQPDIETILSGALGELKERIGFNNDFWYPKNGGIYSLPEALGKPIQRLHLNEEIVEIDCKRKTIISKTGAKEHYEKMISSLPLPAVVGLIKDIPPNILSAAKNLQHNSILCVNLGVNRPNISEKHWIYFYEKQFSFHRISFQMNFSPTTVPEGMSSISTEVAYSQYKKISKTNIIDRVVRDLIRAKILNKDDEIVVSDVKDIKYAYIIYDHNHRKNVGTVHEFLRKNNIFPCGRFGEWEYFNMDHSILSGKRVAETI